MHEAARKAAETTPMPRSASELPLRVGRKPELCDVFFNGIGHKQTVATTVKNFLTTSNRA
jgi:hypothetical protein